MKMPKLKLNKILVINLIGSAIFILIVVYELYFLNGVYQILNPPANISSFAHMKRIDQQPLQEALGRYNATQNYLLPIAQGGSQALPDPFAVIVTGVSGNAP